MMGMTASVVLEPVAAITGRVFNLQRCSVHDGPGIRTTVFLKGCPLRCTWCHNPESISPKMEKMFTPGKCIGCLACIDACPENALTMTADRGVVTDFEACTMCGRCADVCPTGAMEMVAEMTDVQAVVDAVLEERVIIEQSGGGVTFSGGEPLMHHRFLIEALDACRAEGFHCTVDTSGFAPKEILMAVATRTDHWLYDLKSMDAETHLKWTGVRNELILENRCHVLRHKLTDTTIVAVSIANSQQGMSRPHVTRYRIFHHATESVVEADNLHGSVV